MCLCVLHNIIKYHHHQSCLTIVLGLLDFICHKNVENSERRQDFSNFRNEMSKKSKWIEHPLGCPYHLPLWDIALRKFEKL